MPLTKIAFAAGIDKQDSKYGAEGRWINSDYVRFRYGLPEKIGGWTDFSSGYNLIGVARDTWTWNALDGTPYLAVGTNKKLYAYTGGLFADITPIRDTNAGVVITPTNATTVITVTDVAHGASVGDFLTFSATSASFGGLTAPPFDIEYEVQTVPTVNTYTVKSPLTLLNSTPGTATIAYQLAIGTETAIFDYGWGTGTWGTGTWNTPRTSVNTLNPRLWALDNFGENLIACVNNGMVYEWPLNLSNRAVVISGAPTKNSFVLVSTPDRHLVCFGTEETIGDPTSFDPMLVRWSEAEDDTTWVATATNTAGSQRLTDGNYLATAIRSRGQLLVFTDNALYGMQFLGVPYTFGFQQLGTNCGSLSNNAAVDVNGVAYWMSPDSFFTFDGTVKKVPCSVQDAVFQNYNYFQSSLIYCGLNTEFNEVTWFYPTLNSNVIDAYVTYNYLENCWYQGTMARTTWRDRGVYQLPIATEWAPNSTTNAYPSVSGLTAGVSIIYSQEVGANGNGNAVSSYVESAFFDLADGDDISFVKRIVPDFSNQVGTLNFYVVSRAFSVPPDQVSSLTPYYFTSTTQKIDTRIRGRAISLKIVSSAVDDTWRLGSIRLDIQPDGKR
jgi:hypothetical protein